MKSEIKNKLGILPFTLALLLVNIFLSNSVLAATSGTISLTVEVSSPDKKIENENFSFIKLAEITDFKSSLTTSEIAKKIEITPDIIDRDINDIKPNVIDDKMLSFPLLIIYGEGITKDKEKFKFYIGKLKKVELENNNLEKISVQYKGRLKFENRLDSYLITDGNEEETIFKLAPVTNRQISEDEKLVAKMLVNFRDKTGSFSNLFGIPAIVDFEIIKLERKPLRPKAEATQQKRAVSSGDSSVEPTTKQPSTSKKEITNEKEEKEITTPTAEIPSEIKYEKTKRFFLIDWFKRLFRRQDN